MSHPGRKSHLVDKRLQYRFVFVSLSYIAFFLVVLGFSLFIPLVVQLGRHDLDPEKALRAADQFLYLHTIFWPVTLVVMAGIAVHAIRVSHRVAGPLYRHRGILTKVKEGTIPGPFRVRKKDYLQEETAVINAMLDSLREKIGGLQEDQTHLTEGLGKVSSMLGKASSEELRNALVALTGDVREFESKLNSFKVEA